MEFFQTIVDQTKDSTVSKLNLGNDHFCYIIEDGFRAVKEYGKTRIAGGEYYLLPRKPQPPDDPTGGRHYQSYSKRFGHDFSLRLWKNPEGTINPDNFTFIMVHIGNFIHDTEGCLLTNSGFTMDHGSGNYRGIGSTVMYKKLYETVKPMFDQKQVVRWIIYR